MPQDAESTPEKPKVTPAKKNDAEPVAQQELKDGE
jgi:hypothetical protein